MTSSYRAPRFTTAEAFRGIQGSALLIIRLATATNLAGNFNNSDPMIPDEELPVFERLGDVRSRAVTLAKIGFQLISVGRRQEAQDVLSRALGDTQRMGIPEAEVIAKFMQQHNLASGDTSATVEPADERDIGLSSPSDDKLIQGQ